MFLKDKKCLSQKFQRVPEEYLFFEKWQLDLLSKHRGDGWAQGFGLPPHVRHKTWEVVENKSSKGCDKLLSENEIPKDEVKGTVPNLCNCVSNKMDVSFLKGHDPDARKWQNSTADDPVEPQRIQNAVE